MFDQVLNEVLLAAIVVILIPMTIIAVVLMISGRRKHQPLAADSQTSTSTRLTKRTVVGTSARGGHTPAGTTGA